MVETQVSRKHLTIEIPSRGIVTVTIRMINIEEPVDVYELRFIKDKIMWGKIMKS